MITNPIEAARKIIDSTTADTISTRYVREVLEALLEYMEAERRLTATAMRKFAPDLAEQLVQRWHLAINKEEQKLKTFVDFLRKLEQ